MNRNRRLRISVQGSPQLNLVDTVAGNFEHWEKIVSQIFIDAVLTCDKQTILKLADAAEFFKNKLGEDFPPIDPQMLKLLKIQQLRRSVLFHKSIFTIREIAEKVYSKNQLKHHEADGFSALRRKCKALGIRILPSRKIRQK